MDLHARFAPFFPIGDGLVRLEVVEPGAWYDDDPGRATVVVRIIVFDEGPEHPTVRDIKEQQLHAGPAALYDDGTRVDEMLYAQREVLGEVLRGPIARLGALMPHDLLFTDVMTLARARTREDFARALRAKGRLGKYLAR